MYWSFGLDYRDGWSFPQVSKLNEALIDTGRFTNYF